MTTKAAEELYLATHIFRCQGKGWAVYNPNNKILSELPVIYGFNNGGSKKFLDAVLISQDGKCLGAHSCSNEGYMPSDLGILEGCAKHRHEKDFKPHYPDGYRMEFIGHDEVESHEGLQKAFKLNAEIRKSEEGNNV